MVPGSTHEIEYLRSQFRCPICGEVFGLEPDGSIMIFGAEVLREHVAECRRRVKPVKEPEDRRR